MTSYDQFGKTMYGMQDQSTLEEPWWPQATTATTTRLTWCNINGSGKHSDKGVQRVLVEGVDFVQAVQQEEKHGPSCCYSPVLQNKWHKVSACITKKHAKAWQLTPEHRSCTADPAIQEQTTSIVLCTSRLVASRAALLRYASGRKRTCKQIRHMTPDATDRCDNAYLVPGFIDLLLRGLGFCHLLTDFICYPLALFQRLDEGQVFCHVPLC